MKTLLLLLLTVNSFSCVKCLPKLELELILCSDCSTCGQVQLDLHLQTTDANNITLNSSHGAVSIGTGIGNHHGLSVDCCNNVRSILISWNRTDAVGSCCFSMRFPKGDMMVMMRLRHIFSDLWFCTTNGIINLSIDNDKSTIPTWNVVRFNKTRQCFDDTNEITLITFESIDNPNSITTYYICSKLANERIHHLSSCPSHSSTTIIPSHTLTRRQDYSSTLSLHPTHSPILRHCKMDADQQWPTTLVNTNYTLVGGCYNGTVNATRRCGADGLWDAVYCLVEDWFNDIIDQSSMSPERALVSLMDLITAGRLPTDYSSNVSLVQVTFLLDHVLQTQIEHDDNNNNMTEDFTIIFMETTNHLVDAVTIDTTYTADTKRAIGSQLLLSLDDLALRVANASKEAINISNALFLKVIEHNNIPFGKADITGIEVGNNFISIPSELVEESMNVRIGSFYYSNLSHLLPPVDPDSRLVSPVISSSVICQSCPSFSELNRNITINLHVENLALISGQVMCAFFDIERQEDSLPNGSWNTSGCSTTINYINNIVTCSCNHLTSFAILLSHDGIEVSETHYKILGTIGLVLLPISILCMIVIILTYTLIRSLWSLRNYVHVMMCVSLCVAQIVFVTGVERTEKISVCSGIAVALHYLFLVCFMWMLMEGVVLYVMLIRVIIKRPKCYAFLFTISSYLIPAMYMSAMVPVGFLFQTDDLPDNTHYLYYVHDELTACWLNYDSGFVWSFIAPVITILIVNIGFFIMAIVVMVRHMNNEHKNKESKDKINFRNWLQVSVSLTVVMGLTWLVGVIVNIKDYVFMSYLTTVFIAGQGILLFIILVPLSRQVRDAYTKAWKSNRLFVSMTSSVLPSTATNGVTRNGSSDLR